MSKAEKKTKRAEETKEIASRRAYYDKVQEGIKKPKGDGWVPTYGTDRFAKPREYPGRGPESL